MIAGIEDSAVIEHILKHLKQKAANADTTPHAAAKGGRHPEWPVQYSKELAYSIDM